ncbi:hypothetical protein WDU94_003690 [Cyamophila willieti]
MNPRCVKCGKGHLTTQCTKERTVRPTCANCKKDHPANYRGCVIAKEAQIKRNQQRKAATQAKQPAKNNQPIQKPPQRTVHPNKTFADVAGPSSAPASQDNTLDMSSMLNLILNEVKSVKLTVANLSQRVDTIERQISGRKVLSEDEWSTIFKDLGNTWILGGDFNCKHTAWSSRLTNTKGRYLYNTMQRYKVEAISTGSPTHFPSDPNKKPDVIDFFIFKNLSANYMTIENNYDLSSDHSGIILTLSDNIILKTSNPILTNKRTDWKSFKLDLANKISLDVSLETPDQIDCELETLVEDIQYSAWDNTPDIAKKTTTINYPKEIISLVREKRRARKRWQCTRAPSDKTIFNRLVGKLRYEIQQAKSESLNQYLNELTPDKNTDYSLWKATKSLKRPILQAPPLQRSDGSWIRDNSAKATAFANHLADIFTPNEITEDNQTQIFDIPYSNTDYTIPCTTVREVQRTIKSEINPKKAPGYDLITGLVLKELPRIAVVKITQIINASFKLTYTPQSFKIAEVIMLPKVGKPVHELKSYRPISLLPILSKLFEKILHKRLLTIINDKKLVPNHQFGFRSQHNCIEQVHRLTTQIENAIERKKVCSAIFLDVAQAFDKVWHEGLNFKLKQMLPCNLAKLLESYLQDRYFRIKQDDSYSELRPVKAGVPQGSVIGPILYLLYTSDMPENGRGLTATFADDTAFLTVGDNTQETSEKLNQTLSIFQGWASTWRIKLNETKSVHVDFTYRNLPYMPIYLNNVVIPYSNQAKYLGMNLDAKLKWKEHVKKKKEQLNLKYNKMYWLLGRCSKLPVENKLLLYNQVLKPIWTYGIQLWGCTSPSNRLTIEQFQNKVLRGIVNAPWYIRNDDLHRDLGVESVKDCMKRLASDHERRLRDHSNPEAIHLLRIDDLFRRLKRVKPHELK